METTIENVSAPRVPPRCPVCGKIMEIRTYSNRPQLEYYAFCTGCMTEMQFPDSAQWMQIHILNAIRYELKRIGDILEEK